jgi:hypothetical protein
MNFRHQGVNRLPIIRAELNCVLLWNSHSFCDLFMSLIWCSSTTGYELGELRSIPVFTVSPPLPDRHRIHCAPSAISQEVKRPERHLNHSILCQAMICNMRRCTSNLNTLHPGLSKDESCYFNMIISVSLTERISGMVNGPASYSGGPGFKSWVNWDFYGFLLVL